MNTHEEFKELLGASEFELLDPEQRAQVAAHVATCDICFEDSYEFAPVLEQLKNARKRTAPVTLRPAQHVRNFLLAAAVAFLTMSGLWLYQSQTGGQRTDDAMRGNQTIQLLKPLKMENAKLPVNFQWEPVSKAAFYRIYVSSEDQMLVAGIKVTRPSYVWMPSQPVSGGRYIWRVEAYLNEQMKVSESYSAEFSLQPSKQ